MREKKISGAWPSRCGPVFDQVLASQVAEQFTRAQREGTLVDGCVADVGDPQPGAMHDSKAFTASGIAAR